MDCAHYKGILQYCLIIYRAFIIHNYVTITIVWNMIRKKINNMILMPGNGGKSGVPNGFGEERMGGLLGQAFSATFSQVPEADD